MDKYPKFGRRLFIRGLASGIAGIIVSGCVPERKKHGGRQTYQFSDTLAHRILSFEGPLGANETHEKALEALIDGGVESIRPFVDKSRDLSKFLPGDALQLFSSLDNFLKSQGYVSTPQDISLLSRAIDTKMYDCSIGCLLYKAIGERAGIPVSLVLLPIKPHRESYHVLVRFDGSGWHVNWDPTWHQTDKDEDLIKEFMVQPLQLAKGIYFRPLSRRESLGVMVQDLAVAYGDVKKHKDSRKFAQLGVDLFPEFGTPYANLAGSFREEGNVKEAVINYTKAIERDSWSVWIPIAFSELYAAEIGDSSKAMEVLNAIPSPFNEFYEVLTQQGRVLMFQDNYEGAVLYFSKALSMKPGFMNALVNRSFAYGGLENYELSIKDAQEIILIEPDNPDGHYALGVGRFRLGQIEEGISHIDKAIALNPKNETYQEAKKQLEEYKKAVKE